MVMGDEDNANKTRDGKQMRPEISLMSRLSWVQAALQKTHIKWDTVAIDHWCPCSLPKGERGPLSNGA